MRNKQSRINRKLTDDLILQDFFSYQLGYQNFSKLLADLKDTEEGYNSNGITHFCERISSVGKDISVYDRIISQYVSKISAGREPGFRLRYFQYLAILFTEMYLDAFFSDGSKNKLKFTDEINEYIEKMNASGSNKYSSRDFAQPKLAFYMATGSGKTIVMHINYLQYIDHARKYGVNIDNCILVTPSEYMTQQHLGELNKSHIDAIEANYINLERYSSDSFIIKVIDINKLKDAHDKIGGYGVTINIESFGSHNLILVDEGHKGYKSEGMTWANIRKKLSSDGFAFEYSATFEQAISGNSDLYDLYSHAILIDYSYRRFYKDGYGKDFFLINLEKSRLQEVEMRHTLLLGNSLSFLSQLLVYKNCQSIIKEYNIERPLWIFVGSKVSVSGNVTNSDIIDVVEFLEWVTSPSNKFTVMERIKSILTSSSGIEDNNGDDIFSRQYEETLFPYGIRPSNGVTVEDNNFLDNIYRKLLSQVFKSNGTKGIELYTINETDGEIGLMGDSGYFGVIDIGDRKTFLKGLKDKLNKIITHEDKYSKSLFNSIKENPNKINILIGAKKFIEGWDTKRVSSMCLLNIGKNEGAQIIQLFGRGVRLNGLNGSGKRSEDPGEELRALQTLYIFGIKASYLIEFRELIKQDTLYTLRTLEIETPWKKINPPLDIIVLNGTVFKSFKNELVNLTFDSKIVPGVDLLGIAYSVSSNNSSLKSSSEYKRCILDDYKLEMIDWDKIYFRILKYKSSTNLFNLIISPANFKSLITDLFYKNNQPYDLYIDSNLCEDLDLDKIELIETAIFELVKNYIIKFNERKLKEK